MRPQTHDSINQKLKALPSFQDLDDAVLNELAVDCNFVRIKEEKPLFKAGEPAEHCYLVSFGGIKLLKKTPAIGDVVICFCRVGEVLGAAVMHGASPTYPVTAVAIEDSGLIQIPRSVYTQVWMRRPEIMQAMQSNIMGRMLEFHQDKALSAAPVPSRVATFLLHTLDSQRPGYGDTINIRLTRRDIAERVGTSVETVIRTLSGWSQKGWITTEHQHISILDRDALTQLAKAGKT